MADHSEQVKGHMKGLEREPPTDNKDVSTRSHMMESAKRVFAEQGYDGATVKALADAAGVNVSLISYHFGGKEGLYRACLEQFGRERLGTAERVLREATSIEDFRIRLSMFAEEFLRANMRDLSLCKILHREFDTGLNPIAMDVFKGTFLPVFQALVEFISAAQKKNLVHADFDPADCTLLIFGSLSHAVKSDPIRTQFRGESLADPPVLERTVRNFMRVFTDGLLTEN